MPGVAIGPTTTPLLVVGCEPFQPSEPVPPLATQAVAFVLDHDKLGEPPGCICAGLLPLALNVTVG